MTEILGYKIYGESMKSLYEEIINTDSKLHIVSGNPEVLHTGLSNEILFNNFISDNSIIIPDGAGVVLASKLLKNPVNEKIAGIELMTKLINYCEANNKSIYLLGAEESVLETCKANLRKDFPNLNISGSHNGYFDISNCQNIIDDINSSNPYIIFVAMGCPRQETFISKYMDSLNCKLFMGVGGSFDVIACKVNRAPDWMIRLNLEWFYRVAKEPYRIKRLSSIPKFLYKAITLK
jgi:N-acetylglucosaminyldiphosphoundecaprenol N-acetyl-beta-D-mannosaminyltransferase